MATRRKSSINPPEIEMTEEEKFDFEEVILSEQEPVAVEAPVPELVKQPEVPRPVKPTPRAIRRNIPRFTQVK